MKNQYLVAFLGLLLSACSEYPGQSPKDTVKVTESQRDAVTLTQKPNWGDMIGNEPAIGGDCHIDAINDKPGEGPESHTVSQSGNILKISGWAAISGKEGVVASEITLALKSTSSGARLFARPRRDKRPDVADYFKSPASIDSGFKADINLTGILPERYTLEVIQHRDGNTLKCQYTANVIVEK